MNRLLVKLIVLTLLLLTPVTVLAASSSEYYEDAVIRLGNNDAKGAIIQLKNAIKSSPNMLSAHVLLGKTYLDEGEWNNAQNELEKANQLGADNSITSISLAKVYMAQSKYQILLQNIIEGNLSGKVQSDVLVYRGLALIELGQLKKAGEALNKALFINDANGKALSAKALMLLRKGQLVNAETLANRAIKLNPDEAEVWNVKASISHSKGLLKQATQEYTRVLSLEPKHLDAQLARIGIYLDLNKNKEARKELTRVRNDFKFEPRSAYLDSILLRREGESAKSDAALKEASDILKSIDAKIITNSRTLHILAGMAFFDVKEYEQAKDYLHSFIKKYPNVLGPRKMLATIFFEEALYQKTIDILTPTLVESANDVSAATLLSAAYIRNGQAQLGTQLLENLVDSGVNSPVAKRDLAVGYIELGEETKGVQALESIYKKSQSLQIGNMLALMYYKQNRLEEAQGIAEQLVKKQSNSLEFVNLLGNIQAALGLNDKARQQFTAMSSLEGGKALSALNLGKLALAEARPDDARAIYRAVLQEEPSNIAALTEMARLEGMQKNVTQQIRWLEKIRSLDVNDYSVRLALVDIYIKQKERQKALDIALEAKKVAPKNLGVLSVVAQSYIAAGKRDDARYTFNQMRTIALNNSDVDALYRVARLQAGIVSYQDAVETLSIALEYQPANIEIQTRLVEMLLQTEQLELASNLIDKMVSSEISSSVGLRLRGDYWVQRGDAQKGLLNYRKAYATNKGVDNSLGLALVLSRLNKNKEAIGVLEASKKIDGNDQRAGIALTELYLKQQQFKQAAKVLEQLLVEAPNQPMLLNNLANVYDELGDKRALGLAKKAYALAPTDADINDTYGWLLSKAGDAEKALPYLREAYSRNSENLESRYHIAETLSKLNRFDEARLELKAIFNSNRPFPSEKMAKELKEKIQ